MISDTIPVFLNGQPFQVPQGATLHDLLVLKDAALAPALAAGQARATDGRGIAIDGAAVLSAGSIVRVFRSARSGTVEEAADA